MLTTRTRIVAPLFAFVFLACLACVAAAKPGIGYADLMKLRKITHQEIAHDGSWIAYAVMPDRGDGQGFVRAVDRSTEHVVERGTSPKLTQDGAWAALAIEPSFAAKEKAEEDDAPRGGLELLRTSDGERWNFEEVQGFGFSDDGAWLAIHYMKPKEEDVEESPADSTGRTTGPGGAEAGAVEATAEGGEEEGKEPGEEKNEEEEEEKEREPGTRLELVRLRDQSILGFESVSSWAFDPTSRHLALAIATPSGEGNGLFLLDLGLDPGSDQPPRGIVEATAAKIVAMSWADETARLAFLAGTEEEPGEVTGVSLYLLDAERTDDPRQIAPPEGRQMPSENSLTWSRDAERLFVGLRPAEEEDSDESGAEGEDDTEEETVDPYDFEAILADRGVDVWHWEDPRIKTNERSTWKDRSKHLYTAVVHVGEARLVPLADEQMPDIRTGDSPRRLLGTSSERWLRLMTWDGFYSDAYSVDLATGERELIVERTQDTVSMSPAGGHAAYFRDGHWSLVDLDRGEHRVITEGLGVPFENEDHDYPRPAPDYGIGGWATDDSAVLLYDKYDVWCVPTSSGTQPFRLTEGRGREAQRIYRVVDLDDEKEGFDPGEALLLTGFDERSKHSSVWRAKMGEAGVKKLHEDEGKFFRVLGKAEDADRVLYTEESYTEFPDLRVADLEFRRRKKVSEVNPQLDDFDLGTSELVEWRSLDGVPLQGVLIKPANYQPGKRYPVLVYFYRFFSQRLNTFNDPVINHRPSFYAYAGDGYCVFLPDIRFEVGRPGLAATKCLVPGVQRLIDLGVADPDGIALHGHSWSGYQAAQIITQTDIFACAVAGAPVSNMTSAYGGIRWGTGLARQFQYEQSQSRLGLSLWEGRDRYIDNSPLFFADRIETPLLIQFGDEDEAVPWTQGIELYLAMRRLGKPAVMLQYHGEPHHLKKYPNKLDYSLKMKAFIDHFCKGAAAPEWWTDGVPYEGE